MWSSRPSEKNRTGTTAVPGSPQAGPPIRFRAGFALGLCAAILFTVFPCQAEEMGISYEVAVEGVEDGGLREALENASDAVMLRERAPAAMSLLRRRAKKDLPKLARVLRAHGCYAARVELEIDERAKPVRVTFRVSEAEPFRLASVEIGWAQPRETPLPSAKELGLILGEPARAQRIVDAREALLRRLRSQGFPFPGMAEQEVVADHGNRTVSVAFRVEPGPAARFGEVRFQGLQSVDEGFLRNRIPWSPGEPFNGELLAEAQKGWMETGLFSTVEVKGAEALDEDAALPILVTMSERKHRSFVFGASYKTDEGFGGKVSWEHRNFFGKGERLSFGATGSEIGFGLEGTFRRPDFWRRDQSLLLNFRAAEDSPEAYTSQNVAGAVLVERRIAKGLTAAGGLGFRFAEVEQLEEKERFTLVSSPWQFAWDTSNDLFDPTRGGRLSLKLAPFFDLLGADLGFVKGYGSYSRYLQLWDRPSLVLAGRVAAGFAAGAERKAMPADERLYAGGGGSIRGYAFQAVGPLEGETPLGGRSLLETSLELRMKVTKEIGVATFLDGGSAFASTMPEPTEEFRWGAGLGLRYYTVIGPLRLDVAFPLNRRSGVDDSFQIYVSLGQAF